jgi:hypothetical protein
MKGRFNIFSPFILIVAVAILLLRPAIIFSSSTIQSSLNTYKTKAYGLVKVVKKRREAVRLNNIISGENEPIGVADRLLVFLKYAMKKWMHALLLVLSILLSQFTSFIRKGSTLFKVVPDNQHYLALSVIRI